MKYTIDHIPKNTIAFYVWNELLSILENVGRTGLPLPDILLRAVEVLRGKGEQK